MNRITQEFVDFISDLGNGLAEFLTTPYGQLRLVKIPQATYYRKLNKFTKARLIRRVNSTTLKLSSKAQELLRKPIRKKRRTDDYSTIIIFDIPIAKNRERSIFRRYLIKNGFTLLQKSVFISPDQLSDETKDLINELKIRNYVSFLR